jgi:capsular polysaccharide biosynthesis protein
LQIRTGTLALTLLLLASSEAAAEWQLRPFLGLTLGSDTTFVDLAGAAGKPNIVVGASAAILGNIFGIEADLGYAPGFFQSGDEQLVLQNSATTLTGNVIIALPRNKTEYTHTSRTSSAC